MGAVLFALLKLQVSVILHGSGAAGGAVVTIAMSLGCGSAGVRYNVKIRTVAVHVPG